ncbi:NAD(P)-binding protein [Fistulina hepatica ATCC 64428]|nr:NAD(P)-binding protein [Fistulina hepatica ATCC 64428]
MGLTLSSYTNQCFPPKATFSVNEIPDLSGKVYIVTGGNSGVGKEIIKGLLQRNAVVYMGARNPEKAEAAIKELESATGHRATFLQMDLTNLSSVKQAAADFQTKESGLHGLLLNAGVMTPPIDMVTADGYDLQFATNVIGHFVLLRSLLPVLLSTAKAATNDSQKPRVVFTSSAMELFGTLKFDTLKDGRARRKFGSMALYNQSKMANVVLSQELFRRYGKEGIISCAVNPGNLQSELTRYTSWFLKLMLKPMLHPARMGALTQLYAATSPDVASSNGEYFIPWGRRGQCNPASLDPEVGDKLWSWLDNEVA